MPHGAIFRPGRGFPKLSLRSFDMGFREIGEVAACPFSAAPFALSQKRSSLLKKSLLDRLVVPNQVQSVQKTVLLTLEQGSERGMKRFFNSLDGL